MRSASACARRSRARSRCSRTSASPRRLPSTWSRPSARSSSATAASSMPSATEWIASLSPWPEEFGLGRMHALLEELGNPQRAFPSPHVSGWHERLDTDAETFERAVARVRAAAKRVGATQFETLTAAAFAEFAERGVDAAVIEAGLGGRLDATNVIDARVVLLTNVSLEHTEVLGDTREQIAREKLAVAKPGAVVVLADPEFRALVPDND